MNQLILNTVGLDIFTRIGPTSYLSCRMLDIRPDNPACLTGDCWIIRQYLDGCRVSGRINSALPALIRYCQMSGPIMIFTCTIQTGRRYLEDKLAGKNWMICGLRKQRNLGLILKCRIFVAGGNKNTADFGTSTLRRNNSMQILLC